MHFQINSILDKHSGDLNIGFFQLAFIKSFHVVITLYLDFLSYPLSSHAFRLKSGLMWQLSPNTTMAPHTQGLSLHWNLF